MNQTWTRFLPAAIRDKLDGSRSLQQIIGSTGWLFADNLLRMLLGFLVGVCVTRSLGPEQFGLFNYAIAVVTIFSPISLLGLDGIVVRNLVKDQTRRDEILGSAFVMMIVGGLLAVCLALTSVVILRPADHQALLLVGIISTSLIFQAFLSIDFWFQSQVQSKYCALARIFALLLISGVKLFLVVYHAPLIAFVWAGVAEAAIGSLGLVLAYRIHVSRIRYWRATLPMAGELIRDSWPLMLTDLVIFVYLRGDKLILGALSGNEELGVYSVAVMLAEAFNFLPRAFATTIFPSIVELKEGPENIFFNHLQRYYNLMAFLAYAVALPMTFLAGWLVPIIYGAPFARAGSMLTGLVWAGLFMNLSTALGHYLTAMNWTRLHFVVSLIGCVANISLNFLLIPRYGAMGAVAASIISYWLVAHALCFAYKPLHKTGIMMTRAILYPKIW